MFSIMGGRGSKMNTRRIGVAISNAIRNKKKVKYTRINPKVKQDLFSKNPRMDFTNPDFNIRKRFRHITDRSKDYEYVPLLDRKDRNKKLAEFDAILEAGDEDVKKTTLRINQWLGVRGLTKSKLKQKKLAFVIATITGALTPALYGIIAALRSRKQIGKLLIRTYKEFDETFQMFFYTITNWEKAFPLAIISKLDKHGPQFNQYMEFATYMQLMHDALRYAVENQYSIPDWPANQFDRIRQAVQPYIYSWDDLKQKLQFTINNNQNITKSEFIEIVHQKMPPPRKRVGAGADEMEADDGKGVQPAADSTGKGDPPAKIPKTGNCLF